MEVFLSLCYCQHCIISRLNGDRTYIHLFRGMLDTGVAAYIQHSRITRKVCDLEFVTKKFGLGALRRLARIFITKVAYLTDFIYTKPLVTTNI